MYCPRCRKKMREFTRSFHKQRKWVCPRCGKVRFQTKKIEKTKIFTKKVGKKGV